MKDEFIDLRQRTKQYALRIIKLYKALDKDTTSQVVGKQLLRSGTSVGAHYREAYRSRSNAEFISKIDVGLQELDESSYWIELLIESKLIKETKVQDLLNETNELIAIFTSCSKKAKKNSSSK